MVLCGLALDRSAGDGAAVFTAEEIEALELFDCELATLSACDTNVGVRRAGQEVSEHVQ